MSFLNSTTRIRPDPTRHTDRAGLRQVRGLCLVVDLSAQFRHVRTLSVGVVWSDRRQNPWNLETTRPTTKSGRARIVEIGHNGTQFYDSVVRMSIHLLYVVWRLVPYHCRFPVPRFVSRCLKNCASCVFCYATKDATFAHMPAKETINFRCCRLTDTVVTVRFAPGRGNRNGALTFKISLW